jgi:hypothetical protein
MAKVTVKAATVFINEASIDLKLVMSDGSHQRVQDVPFGSVRDFTHDRKKASVTPCSTKGSKHGDRGFTFKLGTTSFTLYPQAKGQFFGSASEPTTAGSYDDLLDALNAK